MFRQAALPSGPRRHLTLRCQVDGLGGSLLSYRAARWRYLDGYVLSAFCLIGSCPAALFQFPVLPPPPYPRLCRDVSRLPNDAAAVRRSVYPLWRGARDDVLLVAWSWEEMFSPLSLSISLSPCLQEFQPSNSPPQIILRLRLGLLCELCNLLYSERFFLFLFLHFSLSLSHTPFLPFDH